MLLDQATPFLMTLPALIVLFVAVTFCRKEKRLAEREKALAEVSYKKKVEILASVVKNALEGFITIDENGIIQTFNPSCEKMFGYSADEAIGQNVNIIMPEPYASQHDGYIRRYKETGEKRILSTGRDIVGKKKNGQEFPISLSVTEFYTSAGRMFSGIVRDISERKEVERQMHSHMMEMEWLKKEAEKANRMKSEFLAMISHEIRTPMNGVIGMTEMLLSTALDYQQKRYASTVMQSAKMLLGVINDILDFSKIEAGKMELESEVFDLRGLCEAVIELFEPMCSEKGITLTCKIEDRIPPRVVGDQLRIRQIISNFISNAVKFTEVGSIDLFVGFEDAPECKGDEVAIKIAVKDTGIGIPEEAQGYLFQQFSQVDASTTRKYGGTGLGLAICKQLAQMMKGDVGVESEIGKGSTFWARVVLLKGSNEIAKKVDAQAVDDLQLLQDKNILVVEDNSINCEFAMEMLKSFGCRFMVAKNGAEALDIVTGGKNKFDIILMDCQMPVMDGYEATKAIKEMMRNGDIPFCPILAMTANSMKGDREKCLAAGMEDYISKPFFKNDLRAILSKWLSGNIFAAGNNPETRHFDDDQIIDRKVIADVKEMMGDRYREIARKFVHNTDMAMARMSGIFSGESKAADLVMDAHSLKSSSAYLGAVKLTISAGNLEMKARGLQGHSCDIKELKSFLKDLEDKWQEARDFYIRES